jgi:hypothetical protein
VLRCLGRAKGCHVLVERRWEAPARASVVHAHYATHYYLKGNDLVAELGKDATPSARALPEVLAYLAEVVVQDACELLSSDDEAVRRAAEDNPVH